MAAALFLGLVLFGAASAENLGSQAWISEFPSLVQVEFLQGDRWAQQCAGNLITNLHVLSLASCFSGPLYLPESRRLRLGSSRRHTSGTLRGVQRATLHPNHGLLGADSDIAVLRMDDYVTYSARIQQIGIIGQGIELPFGLPVTLASWGNTSQGAETINSHLHSLDLVVSSQEECMLQYIGDQTVTENMVCVGRSFNQGRDFDPLDSGAPLNYEGFLVGILAFGDQGNNRPLVATSVAHYTDWIVSSAV